MTRVNSAFLLALAVHAASFGCGDSEGDSADLDLLCDAPPAASNEEALDLYLSALDEPDSAERPCLLERSLAEDATLLSATTRAEGRPSVRLELDRSTESRIESAFVRELVGAPLFRHQEALVRWSLRDDSGAELEAGEDWIEFSEDGRIDRIHTTGDVRPEIELNEALVAWERAWNLRDAPLQAEALAVATTNDVRFSDLLVDVEGRDALLAEIRRQQGLLDGTLDLGDTVEVHAGSESQPILVRHRATISNPSGARIDILNFIRFRDGRIERLSGYPLSTL